MDNLWIVSPILASAKLQKIWAEIEEPLLILFTNPKQPLCLQAQARLNAFHLASKDRVIDFQIEDAESEELLVLDYGVVKYPTLWYYDYGKAIRSLSDINQFNDDALKAFVRGS